MNNIPHIVDTGASVMNNEPVAWINLDRFKDEALYLADCVSENEVENMGITTPLYTHQYERPHNTVLVPCDKLAEMQAEIEALKNLVNASKAKDRFSNYESICLQCGTTIYKPAFKTLTDEEITKLWCEVYNFKGYDCLTELDFKFCREIIRKAQEK
jgi:hypothetical protein